MSQNHEQAAGLITFDQVFKAFKHWRSHKADYPSAGIPDQLWTSIFQLEDEGYSSADLRRLLGLSTSQYNNKKKELCQSVTSLSSAIADKSTVEAKKTGKLTTFCEVVTSVVKEKSIPSLTEKIQSTQQAVSKLKSTDNNPSHYLDTITIIVECIRPDGHRLKIHTTNQSLAVVMATFYQQGVIPE